MQSKRNVSSKSIKSGRDVVLELESCNLTSEKNSSVIGIDQSSRNFPN